MGRRLVQAGAVVGLGLLAVTAGALGAALTGDSGPPPGFDTRFQPSDDAPPIARVEVRATTVESLLALDAVVVPEDPVDLVVRVEGFVAAVDAVTGEAVDESTAIVEVAGTDGAVSIVAAPHNGVLADLRVVEGQPVAPGDVVGTLSGEGFEMVAPVDPSLLPRLYGNPDQIMVRLHGLDVRFDCPLTGLGASQSELALGNPLDAPVRIRCAIPEEVAVFSGIRGRMVVTTGRAEDVPVVPIGAVRGIGGTYQVLVPDGVGWIERDVELGITDGLVVEIVDGLAPGDEVARVFPDRPLGP